MKCKGKTRAFSLIEIAVVVPILLLVLALTYSPSISILKRYTDSRSDLLVSSEVNDAAEWLRIAIIRSLWTGADFTLTVSYENAVNWLRVTWEGSGEKDEWKADRIAFRSLAVDNLNHFYSSRFQTLSPALSIRIYYGDNKKDRADWFISVSAYGLVRVFRSS
jgi:hypothetical protein